MISITTLPDWFEDHGFEEYSDILTKELGVEEYDDFKLLRDEKDANELLHDMSTLKPMNATFKKKFKKQIMKIILQTIAPPAGLRNARSHPMPNKSSSGTRAKRSRTLQQSKQPKTPPSEKRTPAKPSKSIPKPVHKKSRSVMNLRRKPKAKQKTSSSPRQSKKAEKNTRQSRSGTTVVHRKPAAKVQKQKRQEVEAIEEDTYDMGSISLNISQSNKGKRARTPTRNKAQSSADILVKSKHNRSAKSMGVLDIKKRIRNKKHHKEEMNKARGGFTVHTNRRVRVDDGRIGIVKYKGRTTFGKSSEDWIGILVEYGKGQHNGTVNGRSYFRCRNGKGIMVRPDRIIEDLGNPITKPLTDQMKRGSEEIQQVVKATARKKKQQRMKKKRQAEAAAAAKESSNYGGDTEWKPAKFDDYKPDESVGMFKQKLMHSKTLLDKNKDLKAGKKQKVSEIMFD
eukprot:75323_1